MSLFPGCSKKAFEGRNGKIKGEFLTNIIENLRSQLSMMKNMFIKIIVQFKKEKLE